MTTFAYGQTGSGKTHTMVGLQESAIRDLFILASTHYKAKRPTFGMSFFEIYGGKAFDLLNNKAKLVILEDKNNKIQVKGLLEQTVASETEMLSLIEYGNSVRTTHATHANDTSSRSHAICQVTVREGKKVIGKLHLVDLAGSERA